MAKYAWYTRATDMLHRMTVLTIIGGSLYMTGGLVYTLYMNGKKYEQKVIQEDKKEEMNQLEGAVSSTE
ncbi:Cytochrome c oxidase assembly protein COX14 [Nakaseomyces bracarensis]|uniref:Cytochrome c oxidase assembly protein COX14 n=1 Tax=Nakaseomyces bracarensis TaxID=273131 RepID=A0ABR4NUA1_9SACH